MTDDRWAPGIQVWMYPEELLFTSAEQLAEQVAELGCDAASMSIVYHRARRVLPRHGAISVLTRNAVYFTPDRSRYGKLVPTVTTAPELQVRVRRFRDACVERGLGFRAWLVALHDEQLASLHPELSARALDGSVLGHGLCPSAPESVEYVAALARDVAEQLEPELVDLEAWQYPAWEPAYTMTQALEPLSPNAELLATQCFCSACRARMDERGHELESLARASAGPPFGSGDVDHDALRQELGHIRSAGALELASAVADAVCAAGAMLRLLCSGQAEQARLQGVSAASIAPAHTVGIGCGRLYGSELLARFAGLNELVAGTPHRVAVSTNWTSERTPKAMSEDVAALAGMGANGLSLYNLSLVPDEGLTAFRAASAAFRAAVGASP